MRYMSNNNNKINYCMVKPRQCAQSVFHGEMCNLCAVQTQLKYLTDRSFYCVNYNNMPTKTIATKSHKSGNERPKR